ncbi:hypothetical protein V5E97_09535 [Singulisphaera sp. Ch08]|uniref:Uncharacterized protein n=1 Tax=Singulisphaera sp. Ch08 TaxID=3120278 RepID=A0AAU7CMH4_9BACT
MPDAVTAFYRQDNDLLPPREDEIKKVVDNKKAHQARRPVRTPGGDIYLEPPPTQQCQG